MRSTFTKIFFYSAFTILAANAYRQSDMAKLIHYDVPGLKDLLNLKIVSVSKKAEFLFDAPLSASKAKLIVNASVTYEPMKGLHLFCSGKNIPIINPGVFPYGCCTVYADRRFEL